MAKAATAPPHQPAAVTSAGRPLLWLALICVLGAGLRFYRLGSLPPGLFADEALVSLFARQVASAHWFPVYFPQGFGGYHPAIVYLTVLARWLTANHPLAVRFGVAAAGVASLPLVYLALRAVFALDMPSPRATRLALLGTLTLTITFSSVAVNRLGFEVMLPAAAGAGVVGLLAVGLRTGRRRYYWLAGLALGLAQYTYYSARFLPLAVTGALLWVALVAGRPTWRSRLLDLAHTAAASLVIYAPLGLYFWRNPGLFLARAAATTQGLTAAGPVAALGHLLAAAARTLLAISLPGFGDQLARHNLPGRPVFDVFLSLLFWLGVFVALRAWRRRSAALLLTWLAALLLPVVIAFEGQSPHFTRLQGALPAMAGLAALGGVALWEVVAAHRPRWATGLLALGLMFSLSVSAYDYFVRWAASPALFDAFQVGEWRAAQLTVTELAAGRVYLSPELISDPEHLDFDLLLRGGPARDIPGPGCLVYVDRPASPVTYLVDVLQDPLTLARLSTLYPAGHAGAPILHAPEPWPLYGVYQVPAGAAAVPVAHASTARFGAGVALAGFEWSPATLHPGQTLTVTLRWQATAAALPDYNVFVHLYLPGGETQSPGVSPQPVAQSDNAPCRGAFATSRWQAGEIVIDVHTLTLPPDYAPDRVGLVVGLYDWATQVRQPVADADALLPDNRLKLADLPVGP